MATETEEIIHFNDNSVRNIRQKLYKRPINKDNYKIDVDFDDSPQEIRRQRLLQHQKESREAAFNASRAIFDQVLALSDNENDEQMEIDKQKPYPRRNKYYSNKLMMSEWMLEVPEDFGEKWAMVPCPKGRRNLLIACKGKTRAYSRRGEKLVEFYSALPNGNSEEHNRNCTILDCIWVTKLKTYYVLDILAWSTQPFLNCDAEFRRFWLKSKLEETPELKLRDTLINKYPILPLPTTSCSDNLSEFIESLVLNSPLDGFLFYHKEAEYTPGITPLVTWLKPFMLPEVLGISVPPPLDEKPDSYIDLNHHINSGRHKKKEISESTMDTADSNN